MQSPPPLHVCSVLLLLLPGAAAHAAFERQYWGGAAASNGGSHAVVCDEPWAALAHPALATLYTAPAVSAAFHPGSLGLVELRRSGLAAAVPFRWGGLVVGATVYGFELYRELTLALGAALRAGQRTVLGAGLRWQHLMISGYGSVGGFCLDASLRIDLTEHLASTATISGLLATPLAEDGERSPREFRLGLSLDIENGFRAGIEWTGDRWYPLGFAAGVEYRLIPQLALRCGASTESSEYTLGLGVCLARLTLDYGLALHTLLGSSHALSLSLRLA